MRIPIRRRSRRSKGQALVEFALVVPLILFAIFGVVDMGRAIYAYTTTAEAARQAARMAIVDQTVTDVVSRAQTAAPALGLGSGNVDVCFKDSTAPQWAATNGAITCGTSGPQAPACASPYEIGCFAVVTVRSTFVPVTPFIGNLIGSFTLSSTSVDSITYVCPNEGTSTCP